MSDFSLSNHGSIYLLRPLTPAAESWLAQNVDQEAVYLGDAIGIQPRHVDAIVAGAQGDGLIVA